MAAYILHTLTHIFSILSMYERNNRLTVCGDDWFCRRGVHADWTKVCAAHIGTDDATDARPISQRVGGVARASLTRSDNLRLNSHVSKASHYLFEQGNDIVRN